MIKTELIEDYIKKNTLSETAFCKRCRISHRTFKKLYDSNANFNLVTVFKIARVLKIRVYELLV